MPYGIFPCKPSLFPETNQMTKCKKKKALYCKKATACYMAGPSVLVKEMYVTK